jgi:pimeloyl-ACP methyl ester carboxylesterase
MKNYRKYGNAPFSVAVLHGGPGAAGEMAPIARELGNVRGVLEPLQTTDTLDGQVRELKNVLVKHCQSPVTVIGFSWGAWLGWLLAARHPELVGKLILISSGPFEEKYAGSSIMSTRMQRLSEAEQAEAATLLRKLEDPDAKTDNTTLSRFGELMTIADSFDLLDDYDTTVTLRGNIFQRVWPQASQLRSNGKLLAVGKDIHCPVVAIHGDHDPHPADGVSRPLSPIIEDFRFILLEKCGHYPWRERHARDIFYDILRKEIQKTSPLNKKL